MSRKVSGRSSGVVIWHSPCVHTAVPLALEGGWGWDSRAGAGSVPESQSTWLVCGQFSCPIISNDRYLLGLLCPSACGVTMQYTANKRSSPHSFGIPFLPGRQENENSDSSGGARVRRTGAVRWWVLMGSARKVLVERLTFEQRAEQAGLSGGRAGAERRKSVHESPRQEYTPYVWGAAGGPEEPDWIVTSYFVTQNSCMNQLSLKERQI